MNSPLFRLRAALLCGMFLGFGLGSAHIFAQAATQRATAQQEDQQLDQQLRVIAQAHHGNFALFAHNLKTGQTASVDPDQPVQTASVIKLGILLDAAEQIRGGQATLADKVVLTRENQVGGSGVLDQLTAPLTLSLGDTLTLMVILSDNTAANMAIDRLGLAHINGTLQAAGLKQTWLYKKVGVPSKEPMPPDQQHFGLGKTTAREMASVMERLAECKLDLNGTAPLDSDGPLCGALLHMLQNQQTRDSLPRYLEALDIGDHRSAIANKTGSLDDVRNDVALVATKTGPVVISAFTWDNSDQRWTGDNEAEKTLAQAAQAIVQRWSPDGLDADAFSWENPLAQPPAVAQN
jgi:beta-lactamase class A